MLAPSATSRIAAAALAVGAGALLWAGLSGAGAWRAGALVGAGTSLAACGWVLAGERRRRERRAHEAAVSRLTSVIAASGVRAADDGPERVAELVAARLEAHRGEARELRAVIDAVDEPVVATDGAGVVFLCNGAAEGLIGARADKLVGRPISEVFTQADLVRLHGEAATGRRVSGEVRIARAEGVRVYEASAVPAPLPRGKTAEGRSPVVVTLRDVTELSRAVQVKSDFVANASHELRTPIAALRVAVDTLTGGAREDGPMRDRLISVIESNTTRLEEMVRDLLDLSRLESPDSRVHIEPVTGEELRAALSPLFEEVCRERRLTLVLDFAPEIDGFGTDRSLVLVILKNLIENATKFAYEGTTVRVTGRALADGAGRGVRLEVIDEGIGIPLGQQQRIFERYYQVDEARTVTARRRGTGLGLAIVKHAVRLLGGSVKVSSVWKQGTTMTVDLPGVV